MKYCILSINDDRKTYKDRIRERVRFPEVAIPTFNAIENNALAEVEARGLRFVGWNPKRGEAGIWLSTINVWQHCVDTGDTVIVFEDDAIPEPDFMDIMEHYLAILPEDFGFMALWVPDNQKQDYFYNVTFDSAGMPISHRGTVPDLYSPFRTDHPTLAKAYQGYGGVALMFSPLGSQLLLDQIREQGMWSTSDCFIFLSAHAGRVSGFAPHPHARIPVSYDWSQATTIQDTEVL